jgi:hypothetical protein
MARPTNIFKRTGQRKEHPVVKRKAYKRHAAAEYKKALENRLFGSLGGASPVRKIDPKTGKVVAVIDPETGLPLRPGIKRIIQ